MKRSTKKGFTIVELVIVIAIIAILAAVLIPTFASLIQKANESKDTQLVKNLNTALAADNKEHKTMTDALDAAAEFGYDVGKINASATGNEILWDSKNDVFCYLKDGKVEYIPETSLKNGAVAENETYKLWKIYTSEAKIKEDTDANKYFSIYWNSADNFTAPLTVGFDAGECTAITTLNYVRTGDKQDVVIRTNGGTLTVNAPADTVNHYGYATVVTVTEVAKESYHENGKVDEIKLAKGRVVVESDGEVGSVMVTASAAADVKVENKSGKLGGVAASNSDVASKLKNQVTGVDESKVLTTAVDNSKFAGGLGTEDAPYLIATAGQFKNIGNVTGAAYFALANNLVFEKDDIANINTAGDYYLSKSLNGVLDGNGYSIGVKANPTDDTTWNAIFDTTAGEVTVKNLNFYIEGALANAEKQTWYNIFSHIKHSALFENINFFNYDDKPIIIKGNNYGLLASYVSANINVTNCTNYAKIITNASGGTGLWFGVFDAYDYVLTFDKANNMANIYAKTFGYFMGNQGNAIFSNKLNAMKSNQYVLSDHIVVKNCVSSETIFCETKVNSIGYTDKSEINNFADWNATTLESLGGDSRFISLTNGGVQVSVENNLIKVNAAKNGYSYSIVYNAMYKGDDGAHGSFSLTVVLNSNVKAYKAKFASMKDNNLANTSVGDLSKGTVLAECATESNQYQNYKIVECNGAVYYVFNNMKVENVKNAYLDCNPSVTAYEYASDNVISAYTRVD